MHARMRWKYEREGFAKYVVFCRKTFFISKAEGFLLTHGPVFFDETGDFYTFKYMGAREEGEGMLCRHGNEGGKGRTETCGE